MYQQEKSYEFYCGFQASEKLLHEFLPRFTSLLLHGYFTIDFF